MFGLMSWFAEPEIDKVPRRGIAYYKPPGGPLPWSGPRAAPFVAALTKGGLAAKVHPNVPRAIAFTGPLLEVHTLAMEYADFDFASLRADHGLMDDAHQALQDLGGLAVAVHGGSKPMIYRVLRPWMSRLVLWLAPRLAPFDIQSFFRRHYTKIADQSLGGLRAKLAATRARGLPNAGLQHMLARLEAKRSNQSRTAAYNADTNANTAARVASSSAT
jgi:hypothetical protein